MTPDPASPQPSSAAKKTTTIVVIIAVAGVGLCCIIGILAAIAIPNFIRFQARAKQAECKTVLKSAYVAQKSLYADKDLYSSDPEVLGFSPEAVRYTYFLGNGHTVAGRMAASVTEADLSMLPPDLKPGISGECPKCEFTVVCAGNIDNDSGLDVWSVSSVARSCRGEPVQPGVPCNDVSDLEN